MIIQNHFATISKDNLDVVFRDPEKWLKNKQRLKGRDVFVTIEPVYRRRSNEQNKYYWGVIIPILMEEFGYSKQEMHDALKFHFDRIEESGKPPTVRETKFLTTVEFEERNTAIREWAWAEYEIQIPLPNEFTNKGDVTAPAIE